MKEIVFPDSLKISAVYNKYPIKPFIYKQDENGTKYIADIRLISALSKMLNFKYDILIAPDKQYGTLLQWGNWTGMIGMLDRGEADVAISSLSITEERVTTVDFSNPYQFSPITFITGKPKYFSDVYAAFHPFSTSVWITLIITFMVMQLLLYVFQLRRISLSTICVKTFGILFGQSFNAKSYRPSTRFLIGSWMVGTRFASYSYKAVFLSFLTFPSLTGIRNAEELAEASEKKSFLCSSYAGTSAYADVLKHGIETWKAVSDCITRSDMLTMDVVSFLQTDANQRAFIGLKSHLKSYHKDFFIYERGFYTDLRSIAIRKSFCCKGVFDKAINKLAAVGLLDKFNKDETFFLALGQSVLGNYEDNSVKTLTLEDFAGSFIVLTVGLLLASVVFIIEIVSTNNKKNENVQK